jgi:RNA polymerase sigma-70 factor (ECF subfamily)
LRGEERNSKPDVRGVKPVAAVAAGREVAERAVVEPRTAEAEDARANDGARRGPLPADDDLIRRSLAGDEDAFETLVRRHTQRVFNIVGSFFRRRDLIEDIAQEVFAKAYFSLASYTLGRSFEAWLARITVNACYDYLRAQRRRSEQPLPQTADQKDEWLELQMLEAARERHQSEQRRAESLDVAERLLSKLSPEDRLVVVLMDRDGYSVREIARMTGWGQSKVKVRAFRARRALRGAMKRLLMTAERKQKQRSSA